MNFSISLLKKIIQCHIDDTYLNINSSKYNLYTSMYKTINNRHKSYILNIKYRIFGSFDKIMLISNNLDCFVNKIINYDIEEIYDLIYLENQSIDDFYDNMNESLVNTNIYKDYKDIILIILAKKHLIHENKNKSLYNDLNRLMYAESYFYNKNIYKKIIDENNKDKCKKIKKKILKLYHQYEKMVDSPIYNYQIKNRYMKKLEDRENEINDMKQKIDDLEKLLDEMKLEEHKRNEKKLEKKRRLENEEIRKRELIVRKQKINENKLNKFINENNKSKLRSELWYTYYKSNKLGNCFCCMKEMYFNDPSWHCGHILSDHDGGEKVLDNLHPICAKCNLDMKQQHMYTYMLYNEMDGCKNLDKEIIERYSSEVSLFQSVNIKLNKLSDKMERKKLKLNKKIFNWMKIKSKIYNTTKLDLINTFIDNIKDLKKKETKTIKYKNLLTKLHTDKLITKDVKKWLLDRSANRAVQRLIIGLSK